MSGSTDKPLRIAMLGHKSVPSRAGGVEVVVGELAVRMARLGHHVTCYNRKSCNSGDKNTVLHDSLILKTVPTVDRMGLAAVTSSFFAAVCAAFGNYDVVHFHAEGPCAMMWIPKMFGKRCIATVHGLDHKRAKWGRFASFYIKLGERCAVRFADEIIVLSENMRRYFMDEYGRDTHFIPNGTPPAEKLQADMITKLHGLSADEYILYLGRLVPEKGVHYLIDSFKAVKTDKKLVIAGAADSKEYGDGLRDSARDDQRILFTGFAEGQVLGELFSNAYLYVLPSTLEGMPMSLLEAIGFGNCCLVSDIPECAELVKNCGVTFKCGDTDDLTAVLQHLCDDPDAVERCREKSRIQAEKMPDWDMVVSRTLYLYGAADE